MKKMKKALCLALALLMLAALMAGCGTGKTSTPASSGAVSSAPAEPEPAPATDAPEPTAEPEPEPAEDDGLGGLALPLTEEDVSLSYFISFNNQAAPYMESVAANPTRQLISDLTGIEIVYTEASSSEFANQLNIMIAGGEYTDIIAGFNSYAPGFDAGVDDDIIIDLTPYLEEYAPNYNSLMNGNELIYKGIVSDGGYVPAFFGISSGTILTYGPQIRADWCEALNIDPMSLTTYDAYYEALKAMKTEYDATLLMQDVGVPRCNYLISGFDTAGFLAASGAPARPFYQVDGQIKFGFIEEGFKEYLTLANKWYTEGLIFSDFYSLGGRRGADPNTVSAGDVCIWYDDRENMSTHEMNIGDGAAVCAIPDAHPTADAVTHLGEFGSLVANMSCCAITTACATPELAVSYMDFYYSQYGSTIANYGVEGQTCTKNDDGSFSYTELIYKNPDGMGARVARFVYMIDGSPYYSNELAMEDTFTENIAQADDTWQQNSTNEYVIPVGVSMTGDENSEFATTFADIQTYSSEMVLKFVTGEVSLDSFGEFVDQIKALGIDTCIKDYQAAMDRFMNK